jgi:hypothetical protein
VGSQDFSRSARPDPGPGVRVSGVARRPGEPPATTCPGARSARSDSSPG